MGDIEHPSQAPSNAPSFSASLDRFSAVLGPESAQIPNDLTDEQGQERQDAIIKDFQFNSLSEMLEYSALRFERNRTRIHNEHAQKGIEKLTEEERAQAVVVHQAETYHIYLANALHQVQDVMSKYRERKARGFHASSLESLDEGQASLYLQALTNAMEERKAFANVMIALNYPYKDQLNQQQRTELYRLYQEAKNSPYFSEESKKVLVSGNPDAILVHMNVLNQRLIDILAGKADIQGVKEGFLPQHLYLDLLYLEYKKTLEDQKALINSGREKEALISEIAKGADGDTLPAEYIDRYKDLQRLVQGIDAQIKEKSEHRRELTEEMLLASDHLATYQLETIELVSIQKMFGKIRDPEASGSIADTSPDIVRKAIDENMEERKTFHLDRLGAFVDSLEKGMLAVTPKDVVEHASNHMLRPAILKLSQGLAEMLAYPFPDVAKGTIRGFFVGDLERAMGVPNKPEEEWTEEERKAVQEKMKSIYQAMSEFDREKIGYLRQTITVLKEMPPASSYLHEDVKEVPDGQRITPENLEQMLTEYGGPAVYVALFAQLSGDMGDVDDGNATGLLGENKKFLEKVNKNIDIHLDVGRALKEQAQSYWLLALGILGGAAAAYLLPRIARRVRRNRRRPRAATFPDEAKPIQETIAEAEQELNALRANTDIDATARSQQAVRIGRKLKTALRQLHDPSFASSVAVQQEIGRTKQLLTEVERVRTGQATPRAEITSDSANIADISGTQADLGVDARTGKVDTTADSDPDIKPRGKR